ncbi:MAG: hypothetical protein ISS66_17250 [Desulfobacteraceae bacterium]|nr:hypothetical protein [Desulfobacteraceae bacterium]
MEIIHQLPGRVRIRIPNLQSEEYCRQVVGELSNDDRINDLRIISACNSLIVHYDPIRIGIKDVMDLLGEETAGQPTARKGSAAEKVRPAVLVEKTDVDEEATYFKPAISPHVQEKIKQLLTNEDPRKPYSDGRISELLKEENIEVARRTVAKYREIMGIPASNKRRKRGAR